MHRKPLLDKLRTYSTFDASESAMHKRMVAFVVEHENCFDRALNVGHITGSAWVVSPDRRRVLLLHHRKLNRWLQPGGHSDGDPDTLAVALRETEEESGVPKQHIKAVTSEIFDIDIHAIPERGDEPAHEHFDVRFLFELDASIPLARNDESNALEWIPIAKINEFNNERSILRMVEKTASTNHISNRVTNKSKG